METVGIREFRENLAGYLENSGPVAITRHGETIGFFFPVPRRRSEEEKLALRQAVKQLREALAAKGIAEDEIVEEFKELRRRKKK